MSTTITVERGNIFNDAYQGIMNILPYNLKNRLEIVYEGEEGLDYGGLLR